MEKHLSIIVLQSLISRLPPAKTIAEMAAENRQTI
jgi:hypothetical protein